MRQIHGVYVPSLEKLEWEGDIKVIQSKLCRLVLADGRCSVLRCSVCLYDEDNLGLFEEQFYAGNLVRDILR